VALTGCSRSAPQPKDDGPLPITVSYPIEREVSDYSEFTGRTAAVDSVEVRARVFGNLDKINFKEGAMVKKDDVLFEIDPRPYKASLKQAEGRLASLRARLKRLDADFARAQKLIKTETIAQEEYDKVVGDRSETIANIEAQEGTVDQARLDLGYTKVIAPINGRVSRKIVTEGNLVQSGQNGGTLLTTIVSVDPVWAYFDVDEHTLLHVQELIRLGKHQSARDSIVPVYLGLGNGNGFPFKGTIDFVDNQVNPKTGTLRVRGVFPNKPEILSPGLFVRVRVRVGEPHKALLVSDRAIDTDQGQKILYVVDTDNKVITRPIRPGALHDGLRAIESGLKPKDRVIVVGLQQVRPGLTVDPKLVEMPRSEVRSQKSKVSK
jgi:RND family efflux transporter MFP subunit